MMLSTLFYSLPEYPLYPDIELETDDKRSRSESSEGDKCIQYSVSFKCESTMESVYYGLTAQEHVVQLGTSRGREKHR